jgi:hypothetical protein
MSLKSDAAVFDQSNNVSDSFKNPVGHGAKR